MNLLDHLIDEDRDRLIDGDEHSVFILTRADVKEIIHDLGPCFRQIKSDGSDVYDWLLGRRFYVVEQHVPQSVCRDAIYSPRAKAALQSTPVDRQPPAS